jgi:N-acetylglucosamine-6-phosphate deacetylase
MATTLFQNACILTSTRRLERGWLLADGGKIAAFGEGDAPAFEGAAIVNSAGCILLPGFIDVHVHGALDHDSMDATPHAVRAMARFYARHGVTSFLVTTWTDTDTHIQQALENAAASAGPHADGATVLGVHLEGPYINAEKRGAQREQDVRRADPVEALRYLDTGVIRLLSLAPEFEANHWLITECVKRGITVSVAHTAATYTHMQKAVSLGLTHSTHTYNAMMPLTHRDPGTVGAVMTMPQIRCELIADNIHVHPVAMNVLYRAKGVEGVILITDAVRVAGLPDGEYTLDDRPVVVSGGAVRLPDGTLAGSTLTMERALKNFIAATGESLDRLWPASSINAARAAHVADRKGSIEAGKDADLVLLNADLEVQLTMAEGRIIYRSGV